MEKKCYEAENGQKDTGGNPIKIRGCYCGTTACKYLGSNDYPLPKDFDELAIKKHYSSILKSKLI